MTEQQTPDREKKIAEIREALEKATPGPWEWTRKTIKKDKNGNVFIGDLNHWKNKEKPRYGQIILMVEKNDYGIDEISAWNEADAHLIANAPEWLRFLLSELDREREENRKLREEAQEGIKAEALLNATRTKLQSAQQEIERLGNLTKIEHLRNLAEIERLRNLARQNWELANHWMGKHYDDVIKLRKERDKLIEGLRTILNYASEDGVHWKLDRCYTTARDILAEIGVTVEGSDNYGQEKKK